jgi:hypothetical protein
MELVELFKILILKIDLANAKLIPQREYESLRQELGININTSLSGSRAGQWIGGRIKKNKIFLFFRVSDSSKAKLVILRLVSNYDILSDAKVTIKKKKIKWGNYTVI